MLKINRLIHEKTMGVTVGPGIGLLTSDPAFLRTLELRLNVKNNALEGKSSGQFDGNSWTFFK